MDFKCRPIFSVSVSGFRASLQSGFLVWPHSPGRVVAVDVVCEGPAGGLCTEAPGSRPPGSPCAEIRQGVHHPEWDHGRGPLCSLRRTASVLGHLNAPFPGPGIGFSVALVFTPTRSVYPLMRPRNGDEA